MAIDTQETMELRAGNHSRLRGVVTLLEQVANSPQNPIEFAESLKTYFTTRNVVSTLSREKGGLNDHDLEPYEIDVESYLCHFSEGRAKLRRGVAGA